MEHVSIEVAVSTLTQLTQLLAAHGIYAIFVFFLFYFERRAARNVANARNDHDRRFSEKKYSLVLYSVVGSAIVVTATWIYANFLYHDKIAIEGSLEGLIRETAQPAVPGDRTISDRIAAGGDVKFYTRSSELGEVEWALVSRSGDRESLELKFQHTCRFLPSEKHVALVIGSAGEDSTLKSELITAPLKTVRIDFKNRALAAKGIELFYNPDKNDPCKKVGTLSILGEKGLVVLPWLTEIPISGREAPVSSTSIFGTSAAWAQPLSRNAGPKLTGEIKVHLPEQLASPDLEKQLGAQQVLVANGADSLRFIEDQLRSGTAKASVGRTLQVQSLVGAAERIEASGIVVPLSLNLALGKALYEVGDYSRSSKRFDKIPVSELDPQFLLLRGASDTHIGNYDRALASFEAYLKQTTKPQDKGLALGNIGSVRLLQGQTNLARKALTESVALDATNRAARTNLGRVELREGHYDAAAAIFADLLRVEPDRVDLKVNLALAYEKDHKEGAAISLLESVVASFPGDVTALNNLAYLYATKGHHLDRALASADQALKSSPENSAFLDTKGLVLYRLGRFDESLSLLQQAERKNPQDLSIKEHLAEVRRAAATKPGNAASRRLN